MSSAFTESIVEEIALAWLESFGSRVTHGLDIAPGELTVECTQGGQPILGQRLHDARLPWLITRDLRQEDAVWIAERTDRKRAVL